MSNDTILTDDFVAGLLAKEANDASIKYSSVGLEAFRSTKPASKAKPNTRFLGRIIKETTSHNAALLAKETAEAQARLDDLTEAEERKRRKFNPSAEDIRKRQLGDISSILLGRKRKRTDEHGDERDPKSGPSSGDKDVRPFEKGRRSKEDQRLGRKDKDDRLRDQRTSGRGDGDRRIRQGGRGQNRSRSPSSRSRRHRDRSPLNGDNASGDEDNGRYKPRNKRSGDDLIDGEISRRKRQGRLLSDEHSVPASPEKQDIFRGSPSRRSDPLEDLIGPEPPAHSPIRRRGRGAGRGSAVMDSRFSDSYDPQSDAQPDPDEHAWDEAVEVYRDRQKWKQQGADRLRAAGFTDEQIKKWEKGGEKDMDDVRWSKAGEGREWDRGKEA